ncbi:MAG TPA: hypothetical protein PKE06_21525 [Flavilitoribacter sp.]|nr:hypothetical protein [Flavilitoribacter sp.]HMQ86649.1 hypothetical protein [Flavilitoribacter sp.]
MQGAAIPRTIAMAIVGETGGEPAAIRAALEYFGFRVLFIPVARPNDLIAVLNRSALYPDVSDLILCAHGDEGEIIMPELHDSVYRPDEPRGNWDAGRLRAVVRLPEFRVLTTACTLGDEATARAFLDGGCREYIAPLGYIEGNATLVFVVHFYYRIASGAAGAEAWNSAKSLDEETGLYTFWT